MTTDTAKPEATKATTADNKTAEVPDTFDTKEWSRIQALVKAEMQGVVYDAGRSRPLYSKDKATAVAKRDALVKSYSEFLSMIASIKAE